jgi:hypothetical protein
MLGESLVKLIRNDGEWLVLKIIDVDALVALLQSATYPHKAKSCKGHVTHQNLHPSDRVQVQAPQKSNGKESGAASRNLSTECTSKPDSVSSRRRKQKRQKSSQQPSTLPKSGREWVRVVSRPLQNSFERMN